MTALLSLVLLAPPLWVDAKPGAAELERPSIAPLIAEAREALLVIELPPIELPPGHPPMNPADLVGEATGVLIHPHGYALTNQHVVTCERALRARVGEGVESYPVQVVGVDAASDLALLRIESARTDWPHVPLGDDAKLRVGDYVVALGHPFGLKFSASLGILSGRGRPPGRPGGWQVAPYDYLQTDAAINPGNSGGPLLDLSGALVGLNTAVHARGQGIGFAIPANAIKRIIPVMAEKGRFEPGWMGIAISERPDRRVEVRGVQPGAAADGQLEAGDLILSVDGQPVDSLRRLQVLTRLAGGGAQVKVALRRGDRELTVPVVLGAAPRLPDACATPMPFEWVLELFGP